MKNWKEIPRLKLIALTTRWKNWRATKVAKEKGKKTTKRVALFIIFAVLFLILFVSFGSGHPFVAVGFGGFLLALVVLAVILAFTRQLKTKSATTQGVQEKQSTPQKPRLLGKTILVIALVIVGVVIGILLNIRPDRGQDEKKTVSEKPSQPIPKDSVKNTTPVVSIPYAPWHADEPGTILVKRESRYTLIPAPGKWSAVWIRVNNNNGCTIDPVQPKDSCRIRFSAKDKRGFLIVNGVETKFGSMSRVFQVLAWRPVNLVGY